MLKRSLLALIAAAAGLAVPAASHAASAPPLTQPEGDAACVTRLTPHDLGCRTAPDLRRPSAAVVDTSGGAVYVAATSSDRIVRLRRDEAGPGLSYADCTGTRARGCRSAPALDGVSDLALSADGRWLLAFARSTRTLSLLQRDADSGALRFRGCLASSPSEARGTKRCRPTPSLIGAYGLAATPDTRTIYVALGARSAVTAFAREGARLRPERERNTCVVDRSRAAVPAFAGCRAVEGLRNAQSVAVAPDGEGVYAVGRDDDAVVALQRSRSGRLRSAGCVSDGGTGGCEEATALQDPIDVAVTPDDANVYVTAADEASLTAFSRDRSGRLDQIGCYGSNPLLVRDGLCLSVPQFVRPSSIAISPSGTAIFVADEAASTVSVFLRLFSGDLTPIEPPNGCMSSLGAGCLDGRGMRGVQALAATADSGGVYTISQSGQTVAVVELPR